MLKAHRFQSELFIGKKNKKTALLYNEVDMERKSFVCESLFCLSKHLSWSEDP